MKSHPVLVLLLALCVVVLAPVIWEQLYYLHPTPETESAFLKNYTPKDVIERFQDQRHSSSFGHLSGGNAGHKFVTHTAGFDASFTMPSEKSISLMNALRDDASAQLIQNGAQILSQSGDAHDGFHFAYKLGNSIGTLTISPLSINSPVPRVPPFGQGLVDVTTRIDQSEKWFPKVPGKQS